MSLYAMCLRVNLWNSLLHFPPSYSKVPSMENVFGINVLEFQTRSNEDQMVRRIVEHLSVMVDSFAISRLIKSLTD